ncbi:hypothetical protein BKA70DRAFT_1516811, partial [Coprinopsis sp. MPI-PUGE-AT-0042]
HFNSNYLTDHPFPSFLPPKTLRIYTLTLQHHHLVSFPRPTRLPTLLSQSILFPLIMSDRRDPPTEPNPNSLTPITRLRINPGILERAWRLTMSTIAIRLPDDSYRTITAQHFANILRVCDFLDGQEIPNFIPTNFVSDVEFINNNTPDGFGLPSFDPITRNIIPYTGRRITLEDVGFTYQACGFRPRLEKGTISVAGDKKGMGTINRLLLAAADETEDLKRALKRRRFEDHDEDDYSGAGASGSNTPYAT